MNTIRISALTLVMSGLMTVPLGVSTARADDDWRERREEYFEELEERREEAREEAEERWEDEQERLEELREDGVKFGRRGWRRHFDYAPYGYAPYGDTYVVPPPLVRHRAYYPGPVYGYPWDGPRARRYYSTPYPRTYRYYGTPRAGYTEYPYGGRSVRVGPVQVFWHR